MKITCYIYLLPRILLFTIIKDLHAIDDPCSGTDSDIVVDMCTDGHAVEDSNDGNDQIDSVVVRVMKQQANCTCRVSLKNIQGSYTVQMKKYLDLSSSAPLIENCGLAITVDYPEVQGIRSNLGTIQCTSGTKKRVIVLEQNGVIELKSKITDGDFTRGYCMQIYRDHLENGPKLQLNLQCDDPEQTTMMLTTHELVTTKYKDKQIPTEEMASTTVTYVNAETSVVTTKEYDKEEEIASITDTNENYETSTVTTKGYNKEEEDQNTNVYIYIGAGTGGVLVIIATLLIIVCIRKRSKKRTKIEKQIAHNKTDPDSDNGELKDNILYVSADQQDIIEDGNYHTVDLEKKPVVNFGVSDNQTQHISTFDNSNNEYSVVDKTRLSSSIEHASSMVMKISENDMKMSDIHVNQTYAVVDKTNRRNTDE